MLLPSSTARRLVVFGFVSLVAGFVVDSKCTAADEPQTTTGTVKYQPPADEQGIPDFFRLPAHTFNFESKPLPSSSSKIAVSEVTFPSPMQTPHPNNNTVHTEFFRPKAPGKYPGVIVLHILGGDFDLARLVARQLATNNVAALFLKLPYYGPREQPGVDVRMISADPHQTVLGFKQAVVDIRQATAWLGAQPEVDPQQLGITGISLGGITGALAFTAEPQFKKAFLMLAGGDIARIGAESPEAKQILGDWTSKGGTLDDLIAIIRPIDPVTYGSNVRGRQVVMFNASHDEVVPPACTEALWHAFGEPEIKWVDAGHYTAARYILGALTRCTKLFQEQPAAEPLKKAG